MRRDLPAFVKWCSVYLHNDSSKAIIADCFNHAGLQAEIADAARLIDGSDEAELGRATLAALNACRWEPTFNYRNQKRSDWPAYKASGEASIKMFKKRWQHVNVAGANASNIIWSLSVPLNSEHQLTMTATAAGPNDPEGLGQAIRFLVASARSFMDQG